MQLKGMPEGVEFVEIASESAVGYRWENGIVYGAPGHTYGVGAVVVKPADGFDFVYDIATDKVDVTKRFATPKLLAVHFTVTNERDEARLRLYAPRWPGFVSVEEMPSEPGVAE